MGNKVFKKYPIIFIITTAIIIIIAVVFNIQSSKSIKIKNIVGDQQDLEDISLIYSPEHKLISTREIVIDKNGISKKPRKASRLDNIFNNVDDKVLQERYYRDSLFKNDTYIGEANLSHEFHQLLLKNNIEIDVEFMNMKNNHKEGFTLKDIELQYEPHNYSLFKNIIYMDKVYMVLEEIDNTNKPKICIVEIDLNNKSHKVIKSEYIDESGEVVFLKDSKIYIETHNINEEDINTSFLIYDIEKGTFNTSDEIITNEGLELVNYNVWDYMVNENLSILISNNESIVRLDYKVDDTDISLVDFDEYEFDLLSDKSVDIFTYEKIKLIDNNLCILQYGEEYIHRDNDKKDITTTIVSSTPIKFTIIDSKNKSIKYQSEITNSDLSMITGLHIVKD